MKSFALFLSALILALAGCESTEGFRGAVQRRFAPDYKTHDVKADQRLAYAAAKAALADFGFHATKGGPAQGYLEALNDVNNLGPNGVGRQISLRVKFGVAAREPGTTEIAALFSSIEESPVAGQREMATETPLTDSPLYEVFFKHIDERLARLSD
ncbi:hypothetical protein [Nibricoccus sp. IMCC34717]|uniref:hypothetical protein n=1 Tax=Nibricoccus sp. IMCC34717 TaxID=3034021 RepID=UPI00384C662C